MSKYPLLGIGGVGGGPGTVRPPSVANSSQTSTFSNSSSSSSIGLSNQRSSATSSYVGGAQTAGGTGQTAIVIPKMQGVQPPEITIDDSDLFVTPIKLINEKSDMEKWVSSTTFFLLIEFVQQLNDHIKDVSFSDTRKKYGLDSEFKQENIKKIPSRIQAILDALNSIHQLIKDIPPLETPQRFGNLAFRTLIERVEAISMEIHADIITTALNDDLPEGCNETVLEASVIELLPYFNQCFGHKTRLDYGSGHELSFIAWLMVLWRLHFIIKDDFELIVNIVLTKYLDVVRDLQKTYTLEPAGSHGVWGLDDFQFLPYYFGAGQLLHHKMIKPKSIMNKEIMEYYLKDYMYLGCIQYINDVKKGPFYEHSPLLYDISAVHSWSKVNTGMLKMWIAEVLYKFPVVQHLPFGSILTLDSIENNDEQH